MLINSRWIITAAHCVVGKTPSDIRVILGLNNLNSAWFFSRKISNIIKNPDYVGPPRHQNDIALLKLSENLPTSDLYPVCLPSSQVTRFSNLFATGWGAVKDGQAGSIEMNVVDVDQKDDYCSKTYGRWLFNSSIQICANAFSKDVCDGDSGGALFSYSSSRAHGVGIVSWGIICGNEKYPSVFTRITAYLRWIYAYANTDAIWCDHPQH
ncbi:hypothetical protein B4U79_09157 [Dinothrombium tinctorium]|uniref:Peptidase S1 domain-containing protein n=1 Tax=Dinothrombium tinctorium TaxID=1965070 RepID=A0A3S4QVT6_9ACAR|nr:hypothetical protein B4U79_08083 [Dinothrombium tinctorium]RWS08496.1 hypothetical protein B4U79_09157 [Dinothrombium tinctorium]